MSRSPHVFGGDWTTKKLEMLRKYLQAYVTAMKKQSFQLLYIDAFAGTGYRTPRRNEYQTEIAFEEAETAKSQAFLDGSARIALQANPLFDEYIFIEKDEQHSMELANLTSEFPAANIRVVTSETNAYLKTICEQSNWQGKRGVLFLDPYGMQVDWDTIVAIANTRAIDLWLLFPIGIAVNRMLRRDGEIDDASRATLDRCFGSTDWYDVFYRTETTQTLLGPLTMTTKVANIESIKRHFVAKLRTVFADVAENPLLLYTARNNPLYLLCFAVSNPQPRAVEVAMRIASSILGKGA